MTDTYHTFGLTIRSEVPLPSLPAPQSQLDVIHDVAITYGKTPDGLENPKFKGVRFQAGTGEVLLRVDGVATYYVQSGNRITIMPENSAHEDDILVFLMGSAMGALLHQRRILVLHAGALVVNGESVIISGPSGIGKSTLTAGFHLRGYPFLADDVCAVTTTHGRPSVIPGFPRLKLWADVLKKLDTDRNGLQSVRWRHGLEKYFMPVVDAVQTDPIPIKAFFALETTNTNRLEITVLKGAQKVDLFIDNTYRLNFLKGLGLKIDHFQQCAAIAAKVNVFRAVRPNKGFLLNELMDAVEARVLS
ncbi:MAG: hypothetical protein WC799_05650 [Desulfobacteraceae bacterium]|jgi:hypothetical protein